MAPTQTAQHPTARAQTPAPQRPSHQHETRTRARGAVLWLVALLALVLCIWGSVSIGARSVVETPDLGTLLAALAGDDSTLGAVVRARIPRTFTALLAGVSLGATGVAMQAITRNPLAEPGLLGVNSGAAVAVVLAIGAGLSITANPLVAAGIAMLGALAAAAVVTLIAARGSMVTVLLAGASLTAGCGAAISAAVIASQGTLDSFRTWQIGGVTRAGLTDIVWLAPPIVLGVAVIATQSGALNIISLGDATAAGLGVHPGRVRLFVGVGVVIAAGATVALVGPIAFVGLIVAHVARLFSGGDWRLVLALAMVIGPVVLLAADTLGRVILPPQEVPASVVAAVVGAPLFIWLLRSKASA